MAETAAVAAAVLAVLPSQRLVALAHRDRDQMVAQAIPLQALAVQAAVVVPLCTARR